MGWEANQQSSDASKIFQVIDKEEISNWSAKPLIDGSLQQSLACWSDILANAPDILQNEEVQNAHHRGSIRRRAGSVDRTTEPASVRCDTAVGRLEYSRTTAVSHRRLLVPFPSQVS